MTVPAYAIRIALGSDRTDTTDALDRMAAQGWRVTSPAPGIELATKGAGGLCRVGDLIVAGMAFLDEGTPAAETATSEDASADLAHAAHLRADQGPCFVEALSGSFALVVVDLATGVIEGYRDHLGVYPFLYTVQDGVLTCASDPRSVLHLSGAPIAPEPTRIADFLAGDEVDAELTAFAGLRRLPSAHHLRMDSAGLEITRYWRLDPPAPSPVPDAARKVHNRLQAATRARLRGDAPTGAMLSGGLDSSSLACLAALQRQERQEPPLQTLSFVYPGKPYDESTYIEAVTEAHHVAPHLMEITAPPDVGILRVILEEQMDFFNAPGLMKSRRIYHEASALGLGYILDGHGGDEVISMGYNRPLELAARRRWWALLMTLRVVSPATGLGFWGAYFAYIARYGGLSERSLVRRILMRIVSRIFSGERRLTRFRPASDLVDPALRAELDAETRYAPPPQLTERADQLNAEQ
ncbi:MAG: asparagine synthase-related protein, partial [Pseudomonadota bacterium]